MQAMKGATMALGSMNRTMNLPSLQRIAMEFERENDIMEQRQEMMDDAIDDAMDVGLEEEGDEVVEQVLEEIGVDLSQAVGLTPEPLDSPLQSLIAVCVSSARPHQGCSRIRWQSKRLPRQLAVAAVETQATMISKHALTASEDERRPLAVRETWVTQFLVLGMGSDLLRPSHGHRAFPQRVIWKALPGCSG